MVNEKMGEKIGWFILKFIGVFMLIWFLYPRVTLPKCTIDKLTMTYKNEVYSSAQYSGEETYDNGKIIGMAIYKDDKYIVQSFILPTWVREYKDPYGHSGISIRTLMGPVEVFVKAPK